MDDLLDECFKLYKLENKQTQKPDHANTSIHPEVNLSASIELSKNTFLNTTQSTDLFNMKAEIKQFSPFVHEMMELTSLYED